MDLKDYLEGNIHLASSFRENTDKYIQYYKSNYPEMFKDSDLSDWAIADELSDNEGFRFEDDMYTAYGIESELAWKLLNDFADGESFEELIDKYHIRKEDMTEAENILKVLESLRSPSSEGGRAEKRWRTLETKVKGLPHSEVKSSMESAIMSAMDNALSSYREEYGKHWEQATEEEQEWIFNGAYGSLAFTSEFDEDSKVQKMFMNLGYRW